jgi:hypothetical protein
MKLSTQDSQKENKDNFEYEWDDEEEGSHHNKKVSPAKA